MATVTEIINCRSCGTKLPPPFLDLGKTPLANSYVKEQGDNERFYPLAVSLCRKCYLVQLTHTVNPEDIFSDYAYFSSYSNSFLEHAKKFVDFVMMTYPRDRILEIASNDGYLLQYFKQYNVDIIGIEPAKNIAKVAIAKGIPTFDEFFNSKMVQKFDKKFGLIIGNNILAHVPDINDFIFAVKLVLDDYGVATFEFPYLLLLISKMEFDTIYHEHVFYYSLLSLQSIFERQGLEIFDIKFSSMHGGSIRIFVSHKGQFNISSVVSMYELNERVYGLDEEETYLNFASKVYNIKIALQNLINNLKWRNCKIVAYGAPAKGNTLLNYCGLTKDDIDYTVDVSPHKQNLFLPGTQIPIYSPQYLLVDKPEYALMLPWNFKNEILEQQKEFLQNGGHFIIPIPTLQIV